MFETLIESSGPAKRRAGETVVSLVLHTVVLVGAVNATERAVTGGGLRIADTTMIFVPRASSRSRAPVPEVPPVAPRALEPLTGFVPPEIVPGDIPRMNTGTAPFDAGAVVGHSSNVGIPDGVDGADPSTGMNGVFMSVQVEEAAEALSQPQPQYPPMLKHAGISGYVDLEYVIDTRGRVEPGSVRIVASTHDAFVSPAREAIVAGVYRPARLRGSAVRQRVRQRVSFQGERLLQR